MCRVLYVWISFKGRIFISTWQRSLTALFCVGPSVGAACWNACDGPSGGDPGFQKVIPQHRPLTYLLLALDVGSPGTLRKLRSDVNGLSLHYLSILCCRIQICSSEERVQWRHRAGFPPGFLWDAASPGEWRNASWGFPELCLLVGWEWPLGMVGWWT